MKISIDAKGNFKKTYTYLKNMKEINFAKGLAKYAEMGVEALSAATPKDSGKQHRHGILRSNLTVILIR